MCCDFVSQTITMTITTTTTSDPGVCGGGVVYPGKYGAIEECCDFVSHNKGAASARVSGPQTCGAASPVNDHPISSSPCRARAGGGGAPDKVQALDWVGAV